jgi:alpha-tubulin suppressor-like RCC1 family protein
MRVGVNEAVCVYNRTMVCCLHMTAAVLFADIQLNPVKALVHNITSVSCGVDFTVWLSKEGEVRPWVMHLCAPRGGGGLEQQCVMWH